METIPRANMDTRAVLAKKPAAKKVLLKAAPEVPTTALKAYALLQKSLQAKSRSTSINRSTVPAEQIDFLSGAGPALLKAITLAFDEIQSASVKKIPCISKVLDKRYFAFEGKFMSRAVNQDLFDGDITSVQAFFKILEKYKGDTKAIHTEFKEWDIQRLQNTLYSMAIAFCCAIDIQKEGDKKTPGTFFEYFVGYLFACVLGVNPKRSTTFTHRKRDITLPTDFMFDMGEDHTGFHVPVKTSTRERVIQVWAHQRVIDGVLGQDEYLGTPVFLTETKLDKTKKEVVEICLPDQWQLYQGHIAKLSRIYYLDLPEPYANLNRLAKRPICVRPFSNFFVEAAVLASLVSSPEIYVLDKTPCLAR